MQVGIRHHRRSHPHGGGGIGRPRHPIGLLRPPALGIGEVSRHHPQVLFDERVRPFDLLGRLAFVYEAEIGMGVGVGTDRGQARGMHLSSI